MDHEVRMAISTGRIHLGSKMAIREIRRGRAQVAILSSNCPEVIRTRIETLGKLSTTPVLYHSKDSLDLGLLCGKLFPVSAMVINDPGDSRILNLVKVEDA